LKTLENFWQGQQGSNPRPAVLETAALPTELYPYGAPAIPYSKKELKRRFGVFTAFPQPHIAEQQFIAIMQ
jgi:hypothetical protein